MIAHELSLYEQKILSDREFPVQVFMNRPQGKCQYFDMHWHEHIELHYVLEGETKIQLNQEIVSARKGSLVIANSNVLHAGFSEETGGAMLVMIFEMGALSGELAELVHLSSDRFNHLFRESVGTAPLHYINEVRLKKAMNLLKNGEYTAAQVADAVGFSDYNNFGRLFRRYFGCTPMEARKTQN